MKVQESCQLLSSRRYWKISSRSHFHTRFLKTTPIRTWRILSYIVMRKEGDVSSQNSIFFNSMTNWQYKVAMKYKKILRYHERMTAISFCVDIKVGPMTSGRPGLTKNRHVCCIKWVSTSVSGCEQTHFIPSLLALCPSKSH